MKITGIKTNIFSSRHRNAKRNWLILRLQTDEGAEGIGEASMLSYDPLVERLLHEWTERYLIGKDPTARELHWMRMHQDNQDRGGRMFSTALSGVDIALWDLGGKALGVPVHALLGGPIRDKIRVYANGWYTNPGTPAQNSEEALRVVEMGYSAMKLTRSDSATTTPSRPKKRGSPKTASPPSEKPSGTTLRFWSKSTPNSASPPQSTWAGVWRSTDRSGSKNPSRRKTSPKWRRFGRR